MLEKFYLENSRELREIKIAAHCEIHTWLRLRYEIKPSHKLYLKKLFIIFSPGWCGSVDILPACKPKGRWFNSQSGHTPGLQARSSVQGSRGNHTLVFLSLSPSLPFSLKINK